MRPFAQFLDPRLRPSDWAKISPCPISGCWLWVGARLPNGYGSVGVIGRGDKSQLAHRYVYATLVGAIASDLQLDHLCRVRCCVNPSHLDPVTQAENIRRGEGGQHHARKTHCPSGHEYAGDNLIATSARGWNARSCRQCHIESARAKRRARGARPRMSKRKYDELNALLAGGPDVTEAEYAAYLADAASVDTLLESMPIDEINAAMKAVG